MVFDIIGIENTCIYVYFIYVCATGAISNDSWVQCENMRIYVYFIYVSATGAISNDCWVQCDNHSHAYRPFKCHMNQYVLLSLGHADVSLQSMIFLLHSSSWSTPMLILHVLFIL